MLNELTADQTDRFWAKVEKKGATECWDWTGYKDDGGYGTFNVGGGMQFAHRVSWVIENGPIPAGTHSGTMCVLHHCDNPACVNPDHLFLGTQQDNIDDMVEKGRSNTGVKNGQVVLSEEDVLKIRKIGKTVTLRVLADQFGVSFSAISLILRRETWRHI
jgi:hypothetical protein